MRREVKQAKDGIERSIDILRRLSSATVIPQGIRDKTTSIVKELQKQVVELEKLTSY